MPGSNASPGLAAGTPAPAATAKKKAPRGASWQISEGIIALYSAIHANQLSKVDLINMMKYLPRFLPSAKFAHIREIIWEIERPNDGSNRHKFDEKYVLDFLPTSLRYFDAKGPRAEYESERVRRRRSSGLDFRF
jgi:hypothetical protein